MKLFSIPNLLTISRLLSVPVAVWLIGEGRLTAAFWLYVAAAATDALDGMLARMLNARTVLGRYLDPLADKALLVSIYVLLGWYGYLAHWLVILVVFRDILIVGGAILMYVLSGSARIRPLFISKINTFTQLLLAALVMAQLGLGLELAAVVEAMIYVVGATTIASGAGYLISWPRRMRSAQALVRETKEGP